MGRIPNPGKTQATSGLCVLSTQTVCVESISADGSRDTRLDRITHKQNLYRSRTHEAFTFARFPSYDTCFRIQWNEG